MHVGLAAGASERGQLHVEDLQVVADPLRAPLGVDPFLQLGVLRGYADRAKTRLHVVTKTWLRPELLRSEERRVGKSVDLGGRRIIKKKKQYETGYDKL